MGDKSPHDLLQRAARRAASDPFYLASAFATFKATRKIDDTELAKFLGCAGATLEDLALCRRPAPTVPGFQADVRRIAKGLKVDPLPLLHVLREVSSVESMRTSSPNPSSGFLMAARDKPRRRRSGTNRKDGGK